MDLESFSRSVGSEIADRGSVFHFFCVSSSPVLSSVGYLPTSTLLKLETNWRHLGLGSIPFSWSVELEMETPRRRYASFNVSVGFRFLGQKPFRIPSA